MSETVTRTSAAGCCEADHVLRTIFEGTAEVVGEGFFRFLVQHLARALRVPYAFVSECADPPDTAPSRVRTLAFWLGSEFGLAVEYGLSGTPCEDVLRAGECRLYPRDLQALFPDDAPLTELAAESYMGVPLVGSSGRVLGHLAIMDRVPLTDLPLKETVLRFFAARTAAEIERRQAELGRERVVAELHRALANLKTLSGLIPVCAWCRKVRADQGYWDDLEAFVERNTDASFTHSICPDCRRLVNPSPEG